MSRKRSRSRKSRRDRKSRRSRRDRKSGLGRVRRVSRVRRSSSRRMKKSKRRSKARRLVGGSLTPTSSAGSSSPLRTMPPPAAQPEARPFIGAIYGQSTTQLRGYNATLSSAMNDWLSDHGGEFSEYYIILCGPGDEKNEMKHFLSGGTIPELQRESVYVDFEGYPICIYKYTIDGKQYTLVELCEDPTYRLETPNKGSGGSLNTFENMIELFICFAYIRSNYFEGASVEDVYHCAGSGKAQVFRAAANTFTTTSFDTADLNVFWQRMMVEGESVSSYPGVMNTITQLVSVSIEEQISKTITGERFANLENQFVQAINASITTIAGLHGLPEIDKEKRESIDDYVDRLLAVERLPERIESLLTLYKDKSALPKISGEVFKDPEKYTSQLFNLVFRVSGQEISPMLDHLPAPEHGSNRPLCLAAAAEFLEWMKRWSTWSDSKFISYKHLKPETVSAVQDKGILPVDKHGTSLFLEKLEMDIATAKRYLAGFNKGDLIKSILTYHFCPDPMKYPNSVRTY